MKLEKLRVIDDSNIPSRARIKDALVEIPDDVLMKIVSDYNKENNLAPIYKATEENIKELKGEGIEVPLNAEDNFAFLTPNAYGGTEGFNNLQEKINYDTELVPFIEANYTTYQNDIPVHTAGENHLPTQEDVEVQDKVEEGIYNEEWLKKNWKKAQLDKVSRYNNILQLAEKVKSNDFSLYKQILQVAKKYKASPETYTYNLAKSNLFTIFKNNISEEKDENFDEEEKSKLRIAAKNRYNKRYNKEIKNYKDLPDTWKNKLTPLIESGRIETFKKALNELAETESEKNEREGKTTETLLKRFEEIYGFSFLDDSIKKFAAKNDIENINEFLDCFEATLNAFEEGNISFETAVAYFKRIKDYPNKYASASEDWYEPFKSEEEKEEERSKKEERNREADLETESGKKSIDNIKKEINNLAKKIYASKNEEWIKYWDEFYEDYKKGHANGKYTLESFLKNVLYLAKYVVGKIGEKKSGSIQNLLSESGSIQNLLSEIESKLQNTKKALEGFDQYYKDINSLSGSERIKHLKEIKSMLDKDSNNEVLRLLASLSKSKAKKFFEDYTIKNKDLSNLIKEYQEA